MKNNIGPNIEKILADLHNKLRRQIESVATTQEHIGYIEKQQFNLERAENK